jgi:hypothetical protein
MAFIIQTHERRDSSTLTTAVHPLEEMCKAINGEGKLLIR